MRDRLRFSNQNVDIQSYALHHQDMEQSLRLYFSSDASSFDLRFAGYQPDKVREEMDTRLNELEFASALTVLAAVEGAFRIDYLQRCYRRERDPISKKLRAIYKERQDRARLEEDILNIWKQYANGSSRIIGDLIGAFKFRDWLAHGRYWVPKLGRKYHYLTIYALSARALDSFPLRGP